MRPRVRHVHHVQRPRALRRRDKRLHLLLSGFQGNFCSTQVVYTGKCGDGVVQAPEKCDDGCLAGLYSKDYPGCGNPCTIPFLRLDSVNELQPQYMYCMSAVLGRWRGRVLKRVHD